MKRAVLFKKIVFFLILSLFAVYFSCTKAVDGLDLPRDLLNTSSLGALSSHSIRFTLPVSSAPVELDDYVLIDLTYFSGVTEPTQVLGDYTGTPVISVINTYIRITGISFNPGATINIYGITAFNPTEPNLFDVYIRITHDVDGLNIRNEAHVIASPSTGSVVISASIEANVGVLRINGWGSPGMFITFTEGTTVIGSAVCDATGRFSQIFAGIAETTHSILIHGSDNLNRTTPPTLVEVFTRAHELTTVNGIIIPPTIEIDTNQIAPGDPIQIVGRGTPNYKAHIMTEPPVNSFETDVDINGDYSFDVADTSLMELGDHRVYALVQDLFGTQSLFSITLFFRVTNDTPPPDEEPDCDISRGDLNCDSSVDLADFSILLYYWGSSSADADINNDGNVNLVDFSIMMFYWQG